MLAKLLATTGSRVRRNGADYRAATELAVEESAREQARRRAARWHAWLTSPECTFQDRENFERWRSDETNAAAYATLCADLGPADAPRAPARARSASTHEPANHPSRLRADVP
jgi:ferric-dicitrate binding protein FerR (iron transport regulator)